MISRTTDGSCRNRPRAGAAGAVVPPTVGFILRSNGASMSDIIAMALRTLRRWHHRVAGCTAWPVAHRAAATTTTRGQTRSVICVKSVRVAYCRSLSKLSLDRDEASFVTGRRYQRRVRNAPDTIRVRYGVCEGCRLNRSTGKQYQQRPSRNEMAAEMNNNTTDRRGAVTTHL